MNNIDLLRWDTLPGEKMVCCKKCENVWLFAESKTINYGQTYKDTNEIMRGIHSEHFSKYRARCNECNHEFCVNNKICKSEKYHYGFTCEEYLDKQEKALLK